MGNLQTKDLGIYQLHSADEEGKIKVQVVHKPEIGNVWIQLELEDHLKKTYEEHNIGTPVLVSFKDYESYLKYTGSKEFQAIFSISTFIY